MPVRLIALDLDGTIFGDDLAISARTLSAIRTARERGILVTIATGRMFRSARQQAERAGIEGPLICYQGALVQHSVTGEVLFHRTLPLHLAHEVIRATTERGLHLNLYLNDELYVARVTPEALFYAQINMELKLNEVGDLSAWLERQGGAEPTKLVIVTAPEHTDSVLAEFSAMFGIGAAGLQVTKSHPRFTEFTSGECSKGKALQFVAGLYGITRDEVMAIGDGHNDLDMISWAGYGVAMAESHPDLLSAAPYVTLALLEDGAAEAIEKYALLM